MSSKNNNNKLNIPEARDAMNQFKMEAANEVGVDLKKGDGKLVLAGKSLQFAGEKTNYTMPVAGAVAALAVQILAAVAGGTVAYYLIFVVGAWLFALLVYYTVKMM